MSNSWQDEAERQIGRSIVAKIPLGGGDFADAFQATLDDETKIFIKTHQNPPPGFFSTEATGLKWLRESGQVRVPKVLATSDEPPFLALEWIEIGHRQPLSDHEFGLELAKLHKARFGSFGRPDNQTTGSLALPNSPLSNWVEFYASQRLLPLAKLAADRRALPTDCIAMIETVSAKLDQFGGAGEPPSLLHGDLWVGNRVVDSAGNSWLIDPAAHGGHREFDLAMMQLFGGYGEDCFNAYNDYFPLEDDWKSRVSLHQLAPLIVHAIKFGGSYRSATQSALQKYC